MSVLLQGDDITVVREGRRLLDGVTLAVEAGRLVALLGANGAGKTTLIRALAGIVRPSAGTVELAGRAIEGWSRREVARRMALVPQFPVADLGFTALEVVLMGRAPRRSGFGLPTARDLEVATAAMDALGIAALRARTIDALSGGERQRVFLARALAQEPDVLLLDEPTTHLDLRHQMQTLALLRRRCDEARATALVALHDPTLAGTYADEVMVLAAGRAVAVGPTTQVLSPDVLERAYGVPVLVEPHPVLGTPVVVPLPPHPPGI